MPDLTVRHKYAAARSQAAYLRQLCFMQQSRLKLLLFKQYLPMDKIFLFILFTASFTALHAQELKLWYNKPARQWTEALPLGNGRVGAMVFGGVDSEHIQFNEETLWTGGPRNVNRPDAVQYLQPIRRLLFEGKQAEAEKLAEAHFMGKKTNEDNYAGQQAAWMRQVRADTGAAAAGFNDSRWAGMQLPTPEGWENAGIGLEGEDGAFWFSAYFDLPEAWAGRKLVVDLGRIRDQDFTYLNGRRIGTLEGTATRRRYVVEAAVLQKGRNRLAVQVINPFDKGGFTGVKSGQRTLVVYPEGSDPGQGLPLTGWRYMIQNRAPPEFPRYQADYQPFADVWIRTLQTGEATDYRRTLDLSTAISTVSYSVRGARYTREYFVSGPDQVLAMQLSGTGKGGVGVEVSFKTDHKQFSIHKVDDHTLALSLKVRDGVLRGVSYLKAQVRSGTLEVLNDRIRVTGADTLTLYLAAATNYRSYRDVSGDPEGICRKTVQALGAKTYGQIRAAHIKEYSRYFNRFSLNLGMGIHAALPTDQRIRQDSLQADPSLLTLYVQYARYLLIASSRPGTRPANLQGIWNNLLTPPWGSKYTSNINVQMNYWPAELLNLTDCAGPLFRFISELAESGQQTAKDYYGAPGWVLHHNTDLWRSTAPINASNHGIWVTGGAWLCHHLWDHYLFTRDKAFLQQAYPVMKGAASFFVSYLTKDPATGWLISTPSNSPEHGGLVAGPAMDHQIIRSLFKDCIAASEVLQTDAAFRQTMQEKYKQIAPNQIGRAGQLQEWLTDKDDSSDTHRHVSHLWGVYPGTDITWDSAAVMKAARQSLLYRGDDGTGWSLAWKTNLWARFREGDHAMLMLSKLLSDAEGASSGERGGVYPNLFDAHPPFQIDGNFGGAAGFAEMLLQSQNGPLELLPALPSALPEGAVHGLCARGGFVADLQWKNHRLQQISIRSTAGLPCTLQYENNTVRFLTQKGKTYIFDGGLKKLSER